MLLQHIVPTDLLCTYWAPDDGCLRHPKHRSPLRCNKTPAELHHAGFIYYNRCTISQIHFTLDQHSTCFGQSFRPKRVECWSKIKYIWDIVHLGGFAIDTLACYVHMLVHLILWFLFLDMSSAHLYVETTTGSSLMFSVITVPIFFFFYFHTK